jgi:hypothetical protein
MKRFKPAVLPVLLLAVIASIVGLAIFNSWQANQIVYAQSLQWNNPPYAPANVSFATASGTLVGAPTAGANCIYGLLLVNAGVAVTVNVYQDGGTTSVASAYLAASGGSASWQLVSNPKSPYFITNTTTAFVVKQSGTSQINGSVYAAKCP